MAALTERAVLAVLTIGLQAVGSASAQVGPDARPYIYGRPAPDRDVYAPPPPGGRWIWRWMTFRSRSPMLRAR